MLCSSTWRRSIFGPAVAAAALVLAAGGRAHHSASGAHGAFEGRRVARASVTARVAARLGDIAWDGGRIMASTGETVDVNVSSAYDDPGAPQFWADYFASLPHGAELSVAHVYVATPTEVASMCGRGDVLGCYGADEIVVPGESVDGTSAESVAAHEYGHHIAANRVNPPWSARDRGPKHWATYEGVCSRTNAGTAFPGDEGAYYSLNPGEAFAETYRVLSEQGSGAPTWPIVSRSFYPDPAALAAVREDVLEPWNEPTTTLVRARFARGDSATWTLPLATELDGDLTATLTAPRGTMYQLTLLDADTRVLARALLSGTGQETLTHTICGERAVRLRVTRRGRPGSFSLRIERP